MIGAWAASLVVAGTLAANRGAAADPQSCAAAAEDGQHARSRGKLREAHDAFIRCAADACPAVVRHDCAQWEAELANAVPTVVFGAHDAKGGDLVDVTVSIDQEVVLTKLDGRAVTLDPGQHTFRFERSGIPPVIVTAVIKEGERARRFDVTVDSPAAAQTGARKEHTIYPWIVTGIGAATVVTGAVIALTAPALPDGCNASTKNCTLTRGDTSGSAADLSRRAQAGKAADQTTLGLVVGAVGLVVAAGGVVWHFVEPIGAPAASRQRSPFAILPWTTGRSAGLDVAARF